MANPQIEDGHVDIANELAEAMARTYMSAAENKIFWVIIRKTYGWHKKMDRISYSQFEEATGLDRRHIGPALHRLVSRKIIICTGAGARKMSEYGLQKDHDLWDKTRGADEKSDTDLSNKLTPISVTDLEPKTKNLTPIPVPSDTDLKKSDTDLSNKSGTDLSNNKSKKEIQIQLTKEKVSVSLKDVFYSFKENQRYGAIDFDNEFKKFCEYWLGGGRKLKNKKLACHNWLDSAVRYEKQFGGVNAVNKKPSSRAIINHYTDPDELND